MGVHESIEILKKVQEIDREIYALRHELDTIPERIHQLSRELEQEKSRMQEFEAKLKEAQIRQRQKEGELSEKETLIRKYDNQLSQVKTNKEYASLQKEIDSLKADNSMLEDAILSILDEMDRLQGETREEKARLAQLERDFEEKKRELTARAEELKSNLSQSSERRASAAAQVPAEARELYDRIIEKKEGLGLVPVDGETCSACRIEIRPQLLNELRLKESLVICENCSRILYVD